VESKLFESLPGDEARELMTLARRRAFAKGEVVFHRGDPADALHLVMSGRFATRVTTRLGDAGLLSIRSPGDTFGELALVGEEDGERSATVTALEASVTRSVTRRDLDRLRRAHPGVDRVLVAILAAEVRRLSERLIESFYVDAEARIRRRLIELAAAYGPDLPATIPLTQEDIAGLAGTSRATVNRVLREEEKRGTVSLGRSRTTIIDVPGLSARARST
jgi:CRP/FNR family transcriptional regulator, cyclic AMP receptor protein